MLAHPRRHGLAVTMAALITVAALYFSTHARAQSAEPPAAPPKPASQIPEVVVETTAPTKPKSVPAKPKRVAKTAPAPTPEPEAAPVTPPVAEPAPPPATALGTFNPALDLPADFKFPQGTTLTTAGPVYGYRALSAMSATKTATPIEQLPQSVVAIPRSLIDDQKNLTVGESLRNASSVVTNHPASTPAFDSTLLRGFAAEQMIDGLTTYYNPGDREGSINVERIEVLKGPEGMLYGGGSGNTVGGAINIISKLPTDKASSMAGITFGSHEYVKPFFDVNQPISPNILFRLTGEYTSEKSFIDVIETERFNINPTLTLTDKSTTTLTIQGRYSNWEQPEYQGLPAVGTVTGDFDIRRSLFIGPEDIPDSYSRGKSVTATLDHKLNELWSLNVKGKYGRTEFEENVQTIVGADGFSADEPFIPISTWALANAQLFQDQEEKTITGQALAKFDIGASRNKLLFGADYSRLDDTGFLNFAFIPNPNPILAGLGFPAFVDLTDPSFFPYSEPGPGKIDLFSFNTTKGAFVQLQTSLWETLHITAGVRSANVKIEYENTTTATKDVTDTSKNLPRVGAVLDVFEGFSVFAGYSEGMRGQPFLDFRDAPEPEFSDQVEGGIKLNILNQLSGTLTVYEINRENVAVTDPATLQSVAAGVQRSRGFDVDVLWQPGFGFKVLGNYAYTDAEFVEEVPATAFTAAIPAGNKLAGVPRHSGRLWLDYAFQAPVLKGWSIGAGVYWSDEKFVQNNNRFTSDAFHTVDAKIAYEGEYLAASLAIKNLTDEKYFDRYDYFDARVVPSDGTTAYGTVQVKY